MRNELLTVQEVANFLKTTRQQVRKMIQNGQLLAVKVGREYRILLSSLASFVDGLFYSVPLYQYTGWLAALYWLFPIAMALCGIVQILISKSEREKFKRSINLIGLFLNVGAVFVLVLSSQPYPAVMFFTLLLIRGAVMLLKQK